MFGIMEKRRKGLLVVLDGSDGSGKATQAKILVERLTRLGFETDTLSFPDYGSIYGKKIAAFLRGEYGTIEEVSPYFIARLFADDRKQNRKNILSSLSQGKVVILDRYVSSNLFQAAKFKDPKERQAFIRWLYDLEYTKNLLPKEDILLYLYLPIDVSQKLIRKKKKRSQLGNIRVDIQEKDLDFQRQVQAIYDEECSRNSSWKKIVCTKDGFLLARKQVNDKLLKELSPFLKKFGPKRLK